METKTKTPVSTPDVGGTKTAPPLKQVFLLLGCAGDKKLNKGLRLPPGAQGHSIE